MLTVKLSFLDVIGSIKLLHVKLLFFQYYGNLNTKVHTVTLVVSKQYVDAKNDVLSTKIYSPQYGLGWRAASYLF